MNGNVCDVEVRLGLNRVIKQLRNVSLKDALSMQKEYNREAINYSGKKNITGNVLYYIIKYDEIDRVTSICYFKDTCVTDSEIDKLTKEYPNARFGVIYSDTSRKACKMLYQEDKTKNIRPITLKAANDFMKANHQNRDTLKRGRFAIGLYKKIRGNETLIGAAICGRPAPVKADDGYTLEINRLFTKEAGNSLAMLYGACCGTAKEMGYRKVVTYAPETDPGTTIKADGFVPEEEPLENNNSKKKKNATPKEPMQRWAKALMPHTEENGRYIAPVSLSEANEFVNKNHRHHDHVTGCKFAVGLYRTVNGKDTLVGTAICGRPVARKLDNKNTIEINRLCVTEEDNSCSVLYGVCCRIAKEMGYLKAITYILESEPGVSLRASNFVLEDKCCGGKNWTGERKRDNNTVPEELKQRWAKELAA